MGWTNEITAHDGETTKATITSTYTDTGAFASVPFTFRQDVKEEPGALAKYKADALAALAAEARRRTRQTRIQNKLDTAMNGS